MPLPQIQSEAVIFEGGLDQETPRWNVAPGYLREAQNAEIGINGGYVFIQGYERFDGQAAPSDAQYGILEVSISGEFSVGDTVTGATSGDTGVVIAVVTSDTPNYLVLTKTTGNFDAAENLEVSASVEGATLDTLIPSGASTPELDAQYKNLAADEYRGDIAAVPGSGSILGVKQLNNIIYAFRANSGATAVDLYKSTSSGWSLVDLGRELSFTSGGNTEIQEGDTIEGLTSGATADVARVVLLSGSWSAGDAVGKFILTNQTGTFQAENIEVGGSGDLATIAGNSSAITLTTGGRYEMVIANFGGQSGTKRIYGVDGVNRGFELDSDGDVYVPIDTGLTVDAPTHVAVHVNHLFYSFESSAQHSGTGTPYIWSPVFGASELATGDIITGFKQEPGSQGGATLGIYNRNTIHMLYGTSSADWNLVKYRDEVGAYAYTVQQFGFTIFLDDRGITNLSTSQAFGNFQHAILSKRIQTLINTKKTLAVDSCISREKSQYRLFFADGSAIYVTSNGNRISGFMPVLFNNPVTCIDSSENNSGDEVIYYGSTNGFIYQLDKGTSFDGENIEIFLIFHFNFSRSIRVIKRFYDMVFEVEGDGFGEFSFSYLLNYGSTTTPQPPAESSTLSFSDRVWDDGSLWDVGAWDGISLVPDRFKLFGSGENIAFIIRSDSDYNAPLQFNGAHFAYAQRRRIR